MSGSLQMERNSAQLLHIETTTVLMLTAKDVQHQSGGLLFC